MIPIRSGVRVWIATGHTDMRRGMNGLALQVQEGLALQWPAKKDSRSTDRAERGKGLHDERRQPPVLTR